MAAAPEYTVRLDAFEGPLDLLLFLIRRAEVEITDIPIAAITEQYLRHIETLADLRVSGGGRLDIEQAGEFLVMAATLMEIKSRMLNPAPRRTGETDSDSIGGERDDESVDPRAELVRQLLEYKRYRDATDRLEDYRREWEHKYPAGRALLQTPEAPVTDLNAPDRDEPVDIEDLQLIDLVEAFARIVENVDLSRVGEHRVVVDDTPVEVHGDRIVERLRSLQRELAERNEAGEASIAFESLFRERTRAEMIGLFLAILELVKQQVLLVQQQQVGNMQDSAAREIVLKLAQESAAATVATSVPLSAG